MAVKNHHNPSSLHQQTKDDGLQIREDKNALFFHVFVLPKSSRNMIVGVHDGALKIKLTAPPVENAANTLCIAYLAKCLGLSKSCLDIVSGHTNRNKQIRVTCPGNRDFDKEKADIKGKIFGLLSQS